MMLFYVAMKYAMQEICDMYKDRSYECFSSQPLDLNKEGNDAHVFYTIVYGKECMLVHGKKCNIRFSFDPKGWVWYMLIIKFTTCNWPFDPSGCFLFLLIMNDLAD